MDNNFFIPILAIIREYFLEDEDEEINIIEKVENFAEITVPLFDDRQFKRHFRMTPTTFEDLLKKINTLTHARGVGYPRTVLEKEVMVTIWYLGNLESFRYIHTLKALNTKFVMKHNYVRTFFRSVANRFGLSKSTCSAVLRRTCLMLLEINNHYRIISWPDRERQQAIAQNFGVEGIPGKIIILHI